MSSVQVDALGLKLVTPGAMRADAALLKARAEQEFMPAVLRSMVRRLGRVYGDKAVIRIRSLRIRCGLRAAQLGAESFAERLGEDLAAQIAQMAPGRPRAARRPAASAIVQVYRDEAQWQAARLIAAAGRRREPGGPRRDFGRLWAEIRASRAARFRKVLHRCLEMKGLETILARLDAPALARLEPIVAIAGFAAVHAAVRKALAARPVGAAAAPPPKPPRNSARRTADAAAERRSAGTPIGGRPPPDQSGQIAEAGPSTPVGKPQARTAKAAAAVPAPDSRPSRRAPERKRRDGAPVRPRASAPARAARAAAKAAGPPIAPPVAIAAPDRVQETGHFGVHAGAWCGLLFLVNIAVRLELPERLWRIGADEGAVLAAAMARLAGDPEDPAPRLLSAAFPEPPPAPGPIAGWARDELAAGLDQALARLPGAGGDDAALRARIGALETWYGEGAGFDLAAWCAAVHLAVAEAMIAAPIEPGAVAGRFALAGRIETEAEAIRIVLPMAAIDLDIRRAGLDADPGWLPWLGKRLSFVFEGDEA